ncbi:MAG TPA: helix-turn-helix transcriptional regulator [Sphingobium sp.]|uniref:helix-turn-helix domain-containing protein n=1 Tax=Sphingobium sp. TaxID=1912891 RepID=UPI002ED61B3A
MQRGWVVSPQYRKAVEAIKAARESKGISQRELARRLEKPPSFVNKIELLERRIDILEFVQWAKALDTSADELIRSVEAAVSGIPD